MNKLWVDDIRRPPDDSWHWARTNEEAKLIFQNHDIVEASLDHDMGLHEADPDVPDADLYKGSDEADGYQLVKWMVEFGYLPPVVTIHSWNPVGAKRMMDTLRANGVKCAMVPYTRPDDMYR